MTTGTTRMTKVAGTTETTEINGTTGATGPKGTTEMTRTNRRNGAKARTRGFAGALILAPLLAVLLALAPGALSGQSGSAVEDGGPDLEDGVVDQSAAVLEKKADEWSEDRASFSRAADFYRKAAWLRGDRDAHAVENLRKAGRLAYYTGDPSRAVEDFTRAGDLARKNGQLIDAMEAYYDAAWVAEGFDRPSTARRMLRRVTMLSRDPDLVWEATPESLARILRMRLLAG